MSASYTTGPANRLIEDSDTCYVYDANGNLETKTAKTGLACTGGVTSYTWDVLNRLAAIDFADGTAAQYRYDAQGRRIEKSVNGALTKYVYDGDAILLEYDGAGVLQARYSHGEEIDQPLSMARSGASYFYQVDHLGSVHLITDAAGAIVSRYDYDAFGQLESTSFEGVTNPYAFTARERDAESGLMFYRARYYDPRVGRFISEDPIGFVAADLNLYRYVFNSPSNFVDPSGRFIGSLFGTTRAVAGQAVVGAVRLATGLGRIFSGIAKTIARATLRAATAIRDSAIKLAELPVKAQIAFANQLARLSKRYSLVAGCADAWLSQSSTGAATPKTTDYGAQNNRYYATGYALCAIASKIRYVF